MVGLYLMFGWRVFIWKILDVCWFSILFLSKVSRSCRTVMISFSLRRYSGDDHVPLPSDVSSQQSRQVRKQGKKAPPRDSKKWTCSCVKILKQCYSLQPMWIKTFAARVRNDFSECGGFPWSSWRNQFVSFCSMLQHVYRLQSTTLLTNIGTS